MIATGAVTTSAGTPGQTGTADGTGAAARFDGPLGIASDGAGERLRRRHRQQLHPEDRDGARNRHHGRTFSGPQRGRDRRRRAVHEPDGIAGDGTGNLYVTDGDGTIRQIVAATRAVTTFAGAPGQQGDVDGMGGDARFTRPNAIFGDGAGEPLRRRWRSGG